MRLWYTFIYKTMAWKKKKKRLKIVLQEKTPTRDRGAPPPPPHPFFFPRDDKMLLFNSEMSFEDLAKSSRDSSVYFKVSFYLIILSFFRNFPVPCWKRGTEQEQGLHAIRVIWGSTVLHISPPPVSSPFDKLHFLSVEDTEGYSRD